MPSNRRAQTSLQILEERDDPLDVLNAPSALDGRPLDAAITPVIREAIVAGSLAPGTRLSEAQLARRLAVSRTPVRQALVQLEHERLVVMSPHVGASVRAITAQDVEEIYQVRIALEVLATRLILTRMNAVAKAQLNEALSAMRAAVSSEEEYARALDALHLTIMRLSGNRTVEQVYESLVGPIRRFRRINLQEPARLERSLRANLKVCRAIVAGDSAAPQLMGEHLQKACDEVLAILRAGSTSGKTRR